MRRMVDFVSIGDVSTGTPSGTLQIAPQNPGDPPLVIMGCQRDTQTADLFQMYGAAGTPVMCATAAGVIYAVAWAIANSSVDTGTGFLYAAVVTATNISATTNMFASTITAENISGVTRVNATRVYATEVTATNISGATNIKGTFIYATAITATNASGFTNLHTTNATATKIDAGTVNTAMACANIVSAGQIFAGTNIGGGAISGTVANLTIVNAAIVSGTMISGSTSYVPTINATTVTATNVYASAISANGTQTLTKTQNGIAGTSVRTVGVCATHDGTVVTAAYVPVAAGKTVLIELNVATYCSAGAMLSSGGGYHMVATFVGTGAGTAPNTLIAATTVPMTAGTSMKDWGPALSGGGGAAVAGITFVGSANNDITWAYDLKYLTI